MPFFRYDTLWVNAGGPGGSSGNGGLSMHGQRGRNGVICRPSGIFEPIRFL